jgi:hypothetical protein
LVAYLIGVVALVVGMLVGVAVMWGIARRQIDGVGRDRKEQIARVRELEKQLHSKECEYLDRLTAQKRELMIAQQTELRQAVSEARETQRAESELQSKIFSLKVSPYVEIAKSRSIMRSRSSSVYGYQYQLLVNGIPAFAPHFVEERVETEDILDEDKLLQLAREASQAAVRLYTGGVSQFVEIGAPIVRRLGTGRKRGDA